MAPHAPIELIKLMGDARVAVTHDPQTGERTAHGLGRPGEPLLPYLGLRAEGYDLTLGPITPEVRRVDFDAEPKPNGYFPLLYASWVELEAADLPTVDDLADYLDELED